MTNVDRWGAPSMECTSLAEGLSHSVPPHPGLSGTDCLFRRALLGLLAPAFRVACNLSVPKIGSLPITPVRPGSLAWVSFCSENQRILGNSDP